MTLLWPSWLLNTKLKFILAMVGIIVFGEQTYYLTVNSKPALCRSVFGGIDPCEAECSEQVGQGAPFPLEHHWGILCHAGE